MGAGARDASVEGLDLAFDDAQQAIADSLAAFCAERCGEAAVKAGAGRFPAELWRELAALGVLALATPEGDGGACELVAALEPLGRAAFPGPLAHTFLATQLLPEPERLSLSRGEAVAAVGTPPLLPWAPVAQVWIELDGARAFLARPVGRVAPVETLGGEPWGRVALERVEELPAPERAFAVYEIALAAQLAAAGQGLVEATAAHARARRQFGRAIGEFQAVAHPLAECWIRLAAAATLARAAAFRFDAGEETARATAAAARLSARRAALEAAHVCHQLFGALGIALEGPVFHVTRRIRQLVSQPPGEGVAVEALLRGQGLAPAAGGRP
jgi:alkylation response protein AidB-like acyl-CoA dehydrogenase